MESFSLNDFWIVLWEWSWNRSQRIMMTLFFGNDNDIILWEWSWHHSLWMIMKSFKENDGGIILQERSWNHSQRMMMKSFFGNDHGIVLWEWLWHCSFRDDDDIILMGTIIICQIILIRTMIINCSFEMIMIC